MDVSIPRGSSSVRPSRNRDANFHNDIVKYDAFRKCSKRRYIIEVKVLPFESGISIVRQRASELTWNCAAAWVNGSNAMKTNSLKYKTRRCGGWCFVFRLLFLASLVGISSLAVSHTADAQYFNPTPAPQIGSLPVPNAGVQGQYQGYFIKPWYKQGRVEYPMSPQQASPFNTTPWGANSED